MPLARNSRGMAADPIPILQERDFLLRRMRFQKELLSFFFPATVLIASDKNLVDLIFSDEAVQLCNFLQRRNVIPALGEHFFQPFSGFMQSMKTESHQAMVVLICSQKSFVFVCNDLQHIRLGKRFCNMNRAVGIDISIQLRQSGHVPLITCLLTQITHDIGKRFSQLVSLSTRSRGNFK